MIGLESLLFAGCCFFFILIPIFIYIAIRYKSKKKDKNKQFSKDQVNYSPTKEENYESEETREDIGETIDTSKNKRDADKYRSDNVNLKNFKKKKDKDTTSIIKDLFNKNEVCEDCGTEMVYKEEYDSWYCPECHQYK